MNKKIFLQQMFLLLLIILPESAFCQKDIIVTDTIRQSAVKIFLDCHECDMNYIRKEIPYINYVRDIRESQVYILETSQNAGSGGNQYTFIFQGQREFKGTNDTLTFTSSPDQTSTIIREKRTKILKMGLMKYVARTPLMDEIEIIHNADLE